jgi:hypothetical protein
MPRQAGVSPQDAVYQRGVRFPVSQRTMDRGVHAVLENPAVFQAAFRVTTISGSRLRRHRGRRRRWRKPLASLTGAAYWSVRSESRSE